MKRKNKIIPIILSAVLLTNTIAVPALAEEKTKEAGTGTEKEEVVYINLNTNGTLENTYVVNSFSGGDITDYGMYSKITNLNTTDEIKQNGDTITFNSSADKVYYKGELDGVEIPWDVSIKYYLDNTEYTEESLAGKSGALKIKLDITKNDNYDGSFYDDFALQTTLMLDTEKYTSITAENATIANVGSDKQITYTSLPGQGLDAEVHANVTDFEMDAISINGIKMNLDIDVDDEELMDEVGDLIDAVEKLDDGATKIADGTSDLKTGGNNLKSGTSSLKSGMDSLQSGVSSLQSGINQVQAGLDELDNQSTNLTSGSKQVKATLEVFQSVLNSVSVSADNLEDLVEASEKIQTGIDDLAAASKALESGASYVAFKSKMADNGLDLDQLKSGNTAAISELKSAINKANTAKSILGNQQVASLLKQAGVDVTSDTVDEYVALANQLITLLQGNNAAINGMESYMTGLNNSVSNFSDGVTTLQTNYKEFNSAIGDLAETLTKLVELLPELKDGINTFVEEYSKLDNGITAYTNGVKSAAKGNKQLVSGASSLSSGTSKLKSGADSLDSGTAQLVAGIVKLYNATNELADGTGEFRDETSDLDQEVQDKIDEMIEEFSGDDDELVSFVSAKNTKVNSVQFVIQTKAVEVEKEEVIEVKEEKKTFWQKVKDLFS